MARREVPREAALIELRAALDHLDDASVVDLADHARWLVAQGEAKQARTAPVASDGTRQSARTGDRVAPVHVETVSAREPTEPPTWRSADDLAGIWSDAPYGPLDRGDEDDLHDPFAR